MLTCVYLAYMTQCHCKAENATLHNNNFNNNTRLSLLVTGTAPSCCDDVAYCVYSRYSWVYRSQYISPIIDDFVVYFRSLRLRGGVCLVGLWLTSYELVIGRYVVLFSVWFACGCFSYARCTRTRVWLTRPSAHCCRTRNFGCIWRTRPVRRRRCFAA